LSLWKNNSNSNTNANDKDYFNNKFKIIKNNERKKKKINNTNFLENNNNDFYYDKNNSSNSNKSEEADNVDEIDDNIETYSKINQLNYIDITDNILFKNNSNSNYNSNNSNNKIICNSEPDDFQNNNNFNNNLNNSFNTPQKMKNTLFFSKSQNRFFTHFQMHQKQNSYLSTLTNTSKNYFSNNSEYEEFDANNNNNNNNMKNIFFLKGGRLKTNESSESNNSNNIIYNNNSTKNIKNNNKFPKNLSLSFSDNNFFKSLQLRNANRIMNNQDIFYKNYGINKINNPNNVNNNNNTLNNAFNNFQINNNNLNNNNNNNFIRRNLYMNIPFLKSHKQNFSTNTSNSNINNNNNNNNSNNNNNTNKNVLTAINNIKLKNNNHNKTLMNSKSYANLGEISKTERQKIILDNIATNKEKRTTIMIRNIPIKYTDEMILKELQLFTGKFDCFYMPYDSEKGGNRGYAFINFIHPLHILLFYNVFNGKTWEHFESKKVIEFNFANFQGINEIIKHAKNYKGKKPFFFKIDKTDFIEIPKKFRYKVQKNYHGLKFEKINKQCVIFKIEFI